MIIGLSVGTFNNNQSLLIATILLPIILRIFIVFNSFPCFLAIHLHQNQARNFLAPDELFKGEVEEVIGKVQKSSEVLATFRNTYNDHKEKLTSYFKDGATPREWEFSSDLVFSRYEKFTERVQTVKVC